MNCKNCSSQLLSNNTYCPDCGGKVIRNRLTFKNLFASFSEQFLNYDNKFFQTFIQLFSAPEDVIGGYIEGTRKKHVNVISYFAIALTITGLEYFILNKFYPDFLDLSAISAEGSEEMSNTIMSSIQEYQSLFMMLLVPLYALMSRLVFLKNKRFNYTEHVVIFMYVMAQLSIIGTLITLPTAILGWSIGLITPYIFLFQIVYSAFCLKRLYNLSFRGIVLKTLLFIAILIIMYLIAVVLFVIILYAIGGKEGLMQFQKSAQGASGFLGHFFL